MSKSAREKPVLFAQLADMRALPPLLNLVDLLAGDGFDVRFAAWEFPQFDQLPYFDRVKSRMAFRVRVPSGRVARLLAAVRYVARVLWLCLKLRPGTVFVSDPRSAFLGLVLARVLRRRVVYIEYDAMTPAAEFRYRWKNALVRRLARASFVNVLPNRSRAETFDREHATRSPALLVHNFPMSREFVEAPASRPDPRVPLRIYYHGSFGRDHMPLSVVSVLALVKDVQLVIRPLFAATAAGKDYFDTFMTTARNLGVDDRIVVEPPGNAETAKVIASRCDVGLALWGPSTNHNLKTMWGASVKLTQFMAYGLAVIYSTNEEEVASNLEGIGIRCDMHDVQAFAAIVQGLVLDPDRLARLRVETHRRAKECWTFEKEYRKLCSRLFD